MVRDLSFIAFGIIVGLAALIMGASLKKEYRCDLTYAPESSSNSARPALTKHFFRPGSGIGVQPMMASTSN